jgi:NADH dehydrogenase
MLRITLVSSGKIILPELGEKLGLYAQRKLAEQQVDIRLNCKVVAVTGHDVTLSDGTTLTTNTLVWTAGISPHALLDTLPSQKAKGRVLVTHWRGQYSRRELFRLHRLVAVADDLLAETAAL